MKRSVGHTNDIWDQAIQAISRELGHPAPTRTRKRFGLQSGELRFARVGDQGLVLKRSPYVTKEARALQALAGSLNAEHRSTVPRLMLHWPEHNIIATTRLPGRSFGELLTLAVLPLGWPLRPLALNAAENAGRWLAGFNAHAPTGACLSAEREELRARLEGPVGLSSTLVSALMSHFDHLAKRADAPFGVAHGDFSPRNLLVDHRAHMRVIDWEMCEVRARPLHYDRFFFLATLAKRRFDVGANGAFVSSLSHAFERGYQELAGPPAPSAEAAARSLALATVADRQAKTLDRSNGRLGVRGRRAHLSWLCAELSAQVDRFETRSSDAN